MAKQLNDFISQEGISTVHKSAYRSVYSTKTTLFNNHNVLFASVEEEKAADLPLLDLFMAFI